MPARTPLALLLASTLLLTGCGTDNEPEPKFEATPTPTPTAVKEESAEDFIRRWNDEQTRMHSGDTAAYREMTPQCEGCQRTIKTIDEYYAAGGFVETKGRTILSVRPSTRTTLKDRYLVMVDSAPTIYKSAADSPEERLDGGEVLFEVHISRDKDGSWKFVDYAQVERD